MKEKIEKEDKEYDPTLIAIWVDKILSSKIEELEEKLKPIRRRRADILKIAWMCIDENKLNKKIVDMKKEQYLMGG